MGAGRLHHECTTPRSRIRWGFEIEDTYVLFVQHGGWAVRQSVYFIAPKNKQTGTRRFWIASSVRDYADFGLLLEDLIELPHMFQIKAHWDA
jgi:hypothetical protein